MSSTVLSGDFTVYYLSETRRKQIIWTGSGSTTYTVRELYTALQDLFDESVQMDDSIPISAQTPTQFTIGLIDTGDNDDPWYIDKVTMQHLTGGGISTNGWTREQDVNCGLVRVYKTGTAILSSDVGNTIENITYGDSGTLLYVNDDYFTIRPASNGAANNWDSADGTIRCNSHEDTQAGAATTGEGIWANIYTLGTIADNTNIYVIRNGNPITPWWSAGHIDILATVQEVGTLIDGGVLTIYARQYSQSYDHYQVTITSGARTPIPLSTGNDINNNTGLATFTGSGGNGLTFESGNGIYVGTDWASATKKGILTAEATGSSPVLIYYLAGDLTPLAASDAVKEYDVETGLDGNATTTASAPDDYGPALYSGITFTFGATTKDLNNDNGLRPYDVIIDCGGYTLANFYEYTKYVTKRGSDVILNGLYGEQYTGTGEIQLNYDGQTGAFTEGQIVTSAGGATGYITADHNSDPTGTLVLRTVRGTFVDDETITDPITGAAVVNGTAVNLSPIKGFPFGNFAGGQFFGARGVYITNMNVNDANKYELTDSTNTPQSPPAQIPITVTEVEVGDAVSVFITTGNNEIINRSAFNIDATQPSPPDVAEIRVEENIPADTPASGTIRVVRRDASSNILGEDRLSYSSWNNDGQSDYSTFVLTSATQTAYDTDDTAYVPYVDVTATTDTVQVSVIYVTDRYTVTRVRKQGIIPFNIKKQLNSGGLDVTAIRTEDIIVGE